MKLTNWLVVVCLFCCSLVNLHAQNNVATQKLEKITVSGKSYYLYTVKKSEGLYRVAQDFGVSQDEIIAVNPEAKEGLREGQQLKIPVKTTATNTVVKNSYIIKQKETLYSIAKQHNITVDELVAANPELRDRALAVGEVISIPSASQSKTVTTQEVDSKPNYRIHVVKKKETLYSIAKQYDVEVEQITALNKDKVDAGIKKDDELKIPMSIKKYEDVSVVKESEKTTETSGETFAVGCNGVKRSLVKPIKVGVMLPFALYELDAVSQEAAENENITMEERAVPSKSKLFLEFYEGMLLAADTLKKMGRNIQFYVYDTANDSSKVKDILKNKELVNLDLIIGPAYPNELSPISNFAKSNKIPVVYPLSSKANDLTVNSQLFQLNPPDSLLYKEIAFHFSNMAVNKKAIMLTTKNLVHEREYDLAEIIRKKMNSPWIKKQTSIDFTEIQFSLTDLSTLQYLLSPEKENVIIVPSNNEADISKIMTTLGSIADKKKATITVIGMNDWLKFQTVDVMDIHKLNTHIFSTYGIDYSLPETKNFLTRYRNFFHTEPFAISPYFQKSGANSSFSRYGILGYDVTFYFTQAVALFGKDFADCLANNKSEAIQTNFRIKRVTANGGYYNNGLFFLKFGTDYSISRVVLKDSSAK